MATLKELEKAVSELPQTDFERFRQWFEEFSSARFDARIEKDVTSGALDGFAEEALADLKAGRAREL